MTTPLTKTSGRVKAARRLTRRTARAEQRLFLAEGENALREALAVPDVVVEVFATCEATTRHPDLYADAVEIGAPWQLSEVEALASLADAVTPQGMVAVCRFLDRSVDSLLDAAANGLVVCADVRDPGNAGTIIRTADAAGAGGVVLSGHSVDPYNPKTIRASAGSLFHVPLCVTAGTAAVLADVRRAGLPVLAADGAGEIDLYDADALLAYPVAWLFGNEAWGLPDRAGRARRPPGADPDPRPGREPEPRHGRRRVPLRRRARTTPSLTRPGICWLRSG